MVVAFYDYNGNHAGNTSSMIMLGLYLANESKKKVLLLSVDFTQNQPGEYLSNKKSNYKGLDADDRIGMEELKKWLKAGIADKKLLVNNADEVYPRMSLLRTRKNPDERRFSQEWSDYLPELIKLADKCYDYVLCDIGTGEKEYSTYIKSIADTVVYTISQNMRKNRSLLEAGNKSENVDNESKSKMQMEFYLFGLYHNQSKYTLHNLMKSYPILKKNNSVALPYCLEILENCNDGTLNQLFRAKNKNRWSEEYKQYMEGLSELVVLLERRGG